MSDLLQRDLEATLDGEVRFDQVSRALYSTDASVYQIEPRGVVIPRSVDDVVKTIAIAARHHVPVTPRGGGTSQAGQAIGAGLVLDTSKHLNRIVAIDPDARTARVQPGVVLDELNAALLPFRLRFAPDVSSSSRATLGGMMANNSSGARSILYGKTLDHVCEQEVALADGAIARFRAVSSTDAERAAAGRGIEADVYRTLPALARAHADEIDRRFPKVLRRVGGYNLDQFVDPAAPVDLTKITVGSEGTLGFVVEATVALVPLPSAKALVTLEFEHLLEALAATPLILTHHPSAVEVMDDFILGYSRENAVLDALRRTVAGDGATLLCVELYADHGDDLLPRIEALERDLHGAGIRFRSRRWLDAAAQARIWGLREASLGLSTAMKGDGKAISFVEDTAVPPDRLADYIARFLQIISRHRTTAGIYAHASVGCLHVRPVVNLKTSEGVAAFESIANDVADLVLEFGGALSGEHGDGLVRGAFNEKMFGPDLYRAFRSVKRTFDPDGLFNPGRIVDTPPITAHLRFGAGYLTPDPPAYFDYGAHGGFGRAVEMCSGVGACRKTLAGTMCPSYMVTREEAHTTRGRANALRLAMAGRLGDTALADEGVKAVLDLCLECRACKSECPVGVDVARYKSEFLAGYWQRHSPPVATRLFGRIDELAALGSRFAPIANAVGSSAFGRRIAESIAGVDRRRVPPRWARRTLRKRLHGVRARTTDPRSVLFADTFTSHVEPEIGVAAFEVLDRSGIGASLAEHVCCGRPMISQGLLDAARELAARNTALLYPIASRGKAIVFVEPSCLSAVREDAPDLLAGQMREKARIVAAQSVLFEEYLDREVEAGRASLRLSPGPSQVILHVHCHQRSMGLAAPAARLLARIPSAAVRDLDAGCCGMAGSFGYMRDHYEVSRAIGERTLLPAARSLPDGAVLCAAGTSCRHQVAHFTSATAVHPAVLLRSLLEETP